MVSILHAVRDLDRMRQIVTVLVRHGFGEVVQRTGLGSLVGGKTQPSIPPPAKVGVGERVRLVIQELGPSFVKLGQIVSTRPDLVPEEIVVELKKLQDRVPPVPFDQIKPIIEEQLGAPISELYADFDETPLASASIGQVHRATLRTPEGIVDVVVKVQRPNIAETIARDLDLLHILAKGIERSIPESKIYSPIRLVDEFDRAITAELDFKLEGDNADRFTRNFEGYTTTRFPKVFREASSKRVLTLEFLRGKKVYAAVAEGMSGEKIAKTAIGVIIKQIYDDGFFHADPHPGNILIEGTPDAPVIGFVDLGLVGRLTPHLRDKTIDLMVATVREDRRGIADALYAIGRPTKRVDRQAFEAEVSQLSDKYLGKPLAEIEISAMIRDLVQGAIKYGLEIPPDFLMVGKTLMTVEGVGKEIYPELDVFGELKPYFLKLMRQRYSPEKMGQELLRNMTRLGGAAADMPMQLQDIFEDLRKGSLTMRIREPSIVYAGDRLGKRLFNGFIVGSLIIGGSLQLANDRWIGGGLMLLVACNWIGAHWIWLGLKKKSDLH